MPLASIASVLIVGFVFRMQQDSPRLPASPVVAVELAMPSSDSDVHIAPRPDAKPSAGPTFKTAVSGIRAQDVPFAAERRTPPAGGGLINRSFSGSARGRAFDIAGPVADPVVFHHVWPVMPAWVAREKFRGEVLLSFVLQRDGTVGTDVRIERSCGNLDLDQLAVAAFQQWRFAPPQPGTPAKRERARISIPPPPQ